MVTARSFAARNRYDIDVDQEFIALGACQIAAGLSQGFAVAGADSRTAVNDEMGGKTQMVGLIAAATMAAVLFFLTEPLRYLPVAALGAVLIVAADRTIRCYCAAQDVACEPSGLLAVPVHHARRHLAGFTAKAFSWQWGAHCSCLSSAPHDRRMPCWADVPGMRGWHDVAHHQEATTHPGLMVYRFGAGIVFFNAGYFKKRVMELVASHPDVEWLIVDGSTINTRGHHRRGNARIPCRRTGRKGRPLRPGERTP